MQADGRTYEYGRRAHSSKGLTSIKTPRIYEGFLVAPTGFEPVTPDADDCEPYEN